MENLRLTEEDVKTERDVILEERRSRVDNDPGSILQEQMMAALYANHPYGIPIIGWEHEIAALNREDALSYLPALLRAEQRDPGDRRRCRAGGGEEARRGDVRQARAERAP